MTLADSVRMEALASIAGGQAWPAEAAGLLLSAWLAETAEALAVVDATRNDFAMVAASAAWCRFAHLSPDKVAGTSCNVLLRLIAEAEAGFDLRLHVQAAGRVERRVLDRNSRGRAFWSMLVVTPVT